MKDETSGKPQNLFILLSLVLSLTFSFVVAEWVLRYQRQSFEQEISSSEKMEPGMILYDAQLGWKLKPYWSGKHHHYDYDVIYNINREGFRGSYAPPEDVDFSVIGDSFSFGLGVNDNETFTALLNSNDGINRTFRNYSIPGYSTDQQLLLLNRLKDEISSDVILVVYLGNDIFDNMRGYPLQAEHAKPYFELRGDKLVLKNTPVPLAPKSAAARKNTISNIVLGEGKQGGGFSDWLASLEISRRLGLFQKSAELSDKIMAQRFSDSLALFSRLVHEIDRTVTEKKASLSVVLLPGRSYVEQSASMSAQYQEYFRQHIKSSLTTSDIQVIDLAQYLRSLNDNGIKNMYYPNEGHLTSLGHQYVADFLVTKITNQKLQ